MLVTLTKQSLRDGKLASLARQGAAEADDDGADEEEGGEEEAVPGVIPDRLGDEGTDGDDGHEAGRRAKQDAVAQVDPGTVTTSKLCARQGPGQGGTERLRESSEGDGGRDGLCPRAKGQE